MCFLVLWVLSVLLLVECFEYLVCCVGLGLVVCLGFGAFGGFVGFSRVVTSFGVWVFDCCLLWYLRFGGDLRIWVYTFGFWFCAVLIWVFGSCGAFGYTVAKLVGVAFGC